MASIAEREAAVFMRTGVRQPVTLVRGRGTRVWDEDGKEYLDFVAGIAADSLGHTHPTVVGALKAQADTLMHVSNIFYTVPQVELAEILVRESGLSRIFFCNSGAEANEGCIKLVRKWGRTQRNGSFEIIAMEDGFHGRSLAAVTASGTPKYSEPFQPLPPGFLHVPYNDIEALRGAVTSKTCAVLLEPVQGEGGVNVPDPDYLPAVRRLCDNADLALVLDEVQTGMGRDGPPLRLSALQLRTGRDGLGQGAGRRCAHWRVPGQRSLGRLRAERARDHFRWPAARHGGGVGGGAGDVG